MAAARVRNEMLLPVALSASALSTDALLNACLRISIAQWRDTVFRMTRSTRSSVRVQFVGSERAKLRVRLIEETLAKPES